MSALPSGPDSPAAATGAEAPWAWRLETADGHVTGTSDSFESQGDAETWLGAEFEDLLEHGVDQVTLLEGERVAYGPMGLRQA